ncbi:hypothetical protein [Candidatus Poriferisodalis sp.]|uniref:hypothetical protein n=1 Tax=Candidatus Poriferisodalis sp. TaxID=3101277 RepID=UPI003B5A614E
MSGSSNPAEPGFSSTTRISTARVGLARVARRWFAGACVVLATLGVVAAPDDSAEAQTSVAPVLTCGGGMVLDSSSGQCLTPRTETSLRPSSCSAGSVRVAGQYGGHVCQTKVTKQVDTGRTQQVYSHTTYDKVWVPTGAKQVQTGTNRVWVPPKTVTEPLVPPVRVQVGTRTESKVVTRPGPDVLYDVNYQATVTTTRTVKRCTFDPFAGRQCWNETVAETHTETRTRLECCIPGPPITETVTTEVPVYEYRTSRTATIPGYWREEPVYETRETGYWDRVATLHYTTQPIYETVVTWVTASTTLGPCPSGWQPAGSQCSRTVLGPPSGAPTQGCPSGSVPRYGDALGGNGPSVLTCQSSAPGSDTDTGTEQDDSGGPEDSPDGTARSLLHLAGESDERLAELGIHRCSNGLLSYVPCSELPGRTWNDDPDACDGIEGTVYKPDHGGSCVTPTDVLNKCTTPGQCEDTTIRTYCPAIGELADTRLEEHVHPQRGAETYRVCRFDCTDFGSLPSYVRTRINGSYDYACVPEPDPDDDPTSSTTTQPGTTTTTTESTTTTTSPLDDEEDEDETDGTEPDDPDPDDTEPDDTEPDDTNPDDSPPTRTTVVTTEPTPTTAVPLDDECAPAPSATAAAGALSGLRLRSHVRTAGAGSSHQRHMPGDGRYLQVAPGRGWVEISGSVDVSEHECEWVATWVRLSWEDLQPWVADQRRSMEARADTRHLVKRWDALNADQQQLVRQWHRPGAVPPVTVCSVGSASGAGASASCDWTFAHPAAYAWQASLCFEPGATSGTVQPRGSEPSRRDSCWVQLASGVEWIRSVGDYADGRATVTGSGSGS